MTRRLALLLALLVLLPTLVAGSLPALAAEKPKKEQDKSVGVGTGPSPYSQTKVLTRGFDNADGSSYEFDPNTMTVDVDQTTNLRGRQRVNVSWSGAQRSGGRASDPYGENGLQQEYPVMILQCRGVEDASLPAEKQVRPETCFTASYLERSQVAVADSSAAFLHDRDATEADRQRLSGLSPFPGDDVCKGADTEGRPTHLTPFVAASGKVYPACDKTTMPPEAAVAAAFPPNEISAFSDENGSGSVRFEVRSDVENESLGCNDKVACSIVVVPINGLSCAQPAPRSSASPTASPSGSTSPSGSATSVPSGSASGSPDPSGSADPSAPASSTPPTPTSTPTTDEDDNGESEFTVSEAACRKGGRFLPGTSNFTREDADQAVSPSLWWSASNWKNRFAVPITFGLPPDTCDVLDTRPPTAFYGTELLAQAALQWAPAYCLDKKRFKFQLNQTSDIAGFKLMESGGGAAAVVSGPQKASPGEKIGYAPTALTGFGIGYAIDLPDNKGEFTDLRLNARLIAKLLFQSYLGSDLGRAHPGIENNPLGIMTDPEFIALNPGLSQISQEAGATLLSLSNDSDIVEQLTDYIAHDREAVAWISGKADPWGMVINPAYRKISLPRQTVPLLDTFVPTTNNVCRQNNPSVYFSQLAAPVSTLRKISDSLLDGAPNVQTRCDFDTVTNTYKLGRNDRQPYGARFVLGLVSLGDAERYGLRTAALQAKPGTYVAATPAALEAGIKLAKKQAPRGDGKASTKSGKSEKAGKAKKSGRSDKSGNGRGFSIAGGGAAAPQRADLRYAPYVIDQAKIRKQGSAYPGTMIVYTAAKVKGADPEDAEKVAQFIRVSTTEGQVRGSGNGELPQGFVPLRRSGPTAKLWSSAQDVASAVVKGAGATEPDVADDDGKQAAPGPRDATSPVLPAPNAGDSSGEATETPAEIPAVDGQLSGTEPVAMPKTGALSSGLASRVLPLLLLIGMLGLGGALSTRFFVRPPRGGGS